jgi:hypothetical protein
MSQARKPPQPDIAGRSRSSRGLFLAVSSALLLSLVVALFVLFSHGPGDAHLASTTSRPQPEATAEALPMGSTATPTSLASVASVRSKTALPARSPVIDSIEVDKHEVCRGEENFATVQAHDAEGREDRLIIQLGGTREVGPRLPFRLEDAAGVQQPHVLVRGPGGTPAVAQLPPITVKDCEVEQRVTLDVELDPASPHVLTLISSVEPGRAVQQPLVPRSYTWDFGDGKRQVSTTNQVEHSYEGRPTKGRFAHYLLKVVVDDGRGHAYSGSRAYGFPDFGFGALEEGRVLIQTSGRSREGEQRDTGERVRLYHGHGQTVRVDRILSSEGHRDSRQGADTLPVELDVRQVLATRELPAGTSTSTQDLTALRPTEPGRMRILELSGRAGGLPASGRIILSSLPR